MKRLELNQPDYAIAVALGSAWDVLEECKCMPLLPSQTEAVGGSFDAYLAKFDMSVFGRWKDSAHLGGKGGRYRKGYIVRLSHLRSQRNA